MTDGATTTRRRAPRVPRRPDPRERRRRGLRAFSTVLLVAGALLLTDAGLTVAWQEPVTALVAKLGQDGLREDLRALERAAPTPLELRALTELETTRRRTTFLARSLQRRTAEGEALGRVRIPAIGLERVVVAGTAPGPLRKGPGFYEDQPLPGARGTAAIAGHRTTYGAPFRKLDDVDRGDRVVVEMPYGRFTYRVTGSRIVEPDDLSVLDRGREDRLVLTACHPLYSAAQRIVVTARLERTEPRGAARLGSRP